MPRLLHGPRLRALAAAGVVAAAGCEQRRGDRVTADRAQGSAPCRPARSAVELTEAMGRAGGDARWVLAESPTPPLPARWPNARGGGVVYFTYEFTPLPTGRVVSRVRGPMRQITFATLDASPVVQPLDAAVLGTVDDSAVSDDDGPIRLAAASEALIEIVAGCRDEAGAHGDLAPYRNWLRENRPIATDLERRVPAFIAWLRDGG